MTFLFLRQHCIKNRRDSVKDIDMLCLGTLWKTIVRKQTKASGTNLKVSFRLTSPQIADLVSVEPKRKCLYGVGVVSGMSKS